MDAHSNPDPTVEEDEDRGGIIGALLGHGLSGTLVRFGLLAAAIIALTLVANRCGDDDKESSVVNAAEATTPDTEPTAQPAAPTPQPTAEPTAEPTIQPTPEATPQPAPTEAADSLGAATVDATIADGVVTLAGTSTNALVGEALAAAVTGALGPDHVVDNLSIDPGAELSGITIKLVGSAEESTAAAMEAALDSVDTTTVTTDGLEVTASIDVVTELNTLFAASPVRFAVGSAEILPASTPILDEVIAGLSANPGLAVTIKGHTDSTGDPLDNQTLSAQRADAVLNYLVDNGIARDRLDSVGVGQNEPIADNNTQAGRRQNRRIEFELR